MPLQKIMPQNNACLAPKLSMLIGECWQQDEEKEFVAIFSAKKSGYQ